MNRDIFHKLYKPIAVPELSMLRIDHNGHIRDREGLDVPIYTEHGVKCMFYEKKMYPIYHLVARSWKYAENYHLITSSIYKNAIKAYRTDVFYPVSACPMYAVTPSGTIFLISLGTVRTAEEFLKTDDLYSEEYNRLRRIVVKTYVDWDVPKAEYEEGLFSVDIDTYKDFLSTHTTSISEQKINTVE